MLYADRCRETTLSSGTGAIALLGAGTGYQSFNTAFGTGTTFPYCIAGQTSAEWEVGTGTLSAASTLVRSSVLASSNGGSLVNFSAGTKDVFCTLPAGLIVDPSTSQTLSNKSFATPVSITEAVGVSALTLVGATQTVSTPVLNASQTWNNAGTTFTGLKLNITDTASNAASLLADLQVGGTSKMSLDKAGNLTIAGSPTIQQTGYLHWTGRTYLLANADGNLTVTNNAQTSQLKLLIAGNGQWQFGAADAASPVAQTFGVQSVVAGTTDTAGANFTINGVQQRRPGHGDGRRWFDCLSDFGCGWLDGICAECAHCRAHAGSGQVCDVHRKYYDHREHSGIHHHCDKCVRGWEYQRPPSAGCGRYSRSASQRKCTDFPPLQHVHRRVEFRARDVPVELKRPDDRDGEARDRGRPRTSPLH